MEGIQGSKKNRGPGLGAGKIDQLSLVSGPQSLASSPQVFPPEAQRFAIPPGHGINFVNEEEIDQGRSSQERPEGDGEFPTGTLDQHQRDTDQRPHDRSKKNDRQHSRSTKKSAKHRQEFDIPQSHPLLFGQPFVAEGNRQQDAATEQDPQQ